MAVAEAYVVTNEESWRNPKHRQQWRNTLTTYVYSAIGELPVVDVETAHVLSILEPIWKTLRNCKPHSRAHRNGAR